MSYLHWYNGMYNNRREYAVPNFPGTTITVEWNDEWQNDETHVTSAKITIEQNQQPIFSEEYLDGVPFYPDDEEELVEWVLRHGILGNGAKQQLLEKKLDEAKAELAKFEATDTITPIRQAIVAAAATTDDQALIATVNSVKIAIERYHSVLHRIASLKQWTIPPIEKELAACTSDTVSKLKKTLFAN